MRRLLAVFASVLMVVVLAPLSTSGAGGATTDVYAVHGLNLDGQTSQTDGGTNVTVCADGATLIGDFQFGDVAGPVPVPSGVSIKIDVFGGADVDCTSNGGNGDLISQDVTASGAAAALVATSNAGDGLEPQLVPIGLDVACTDPGVGRVTGVHAANAPVVDVLVDGSNAGSIAYGEELTADLPVGLHTVEVQLGGNPIAGPLDVDVTQGVLAIAYVVGNQPGQGSTPVVPLLQLIETGTCSQPTTTTTVAPTTTATAQPQPVAPTFTG